MSDENTPATQQHGGSGQPAPTEDAGTAKVIYILYLVGIAVGLTTLVGVVMAYVNRSNAPPWLESHYRFQIRTFWIGLLYSIVGMLTSVIIVGWFILLFVLVWLIVRCVKGLTWAGNRQAVENVDTWMFP